MLQTRFVAYVVCVVKGFWETIEKTDGPKQISAEFEHPMQAHLEVDYEN